MAFPGEVLVAEAPAQPWCADLVIQDIKLVERSRKWAVIAFDIVNTGWMPAKMMEGKQPQSALQAHFSGAVRLSRGAIQVLKQPVVLDKNAPSQLMPQQKLHRSIRIDLRKRSTYMPNLILTLETLTATGECDRTNNAAHLFINAGK